MKLDEIYTENAVAAIYHAGVLAVLFE